MASAISRAEVSLWRSRLPTVKLSLFPTTFRGLKHQAQSHCHCQLKCCNQADQLNWGHWPQLVLGPPPVSSVNNRFSNLSGRWSFWASWMSFSLEPLYLSWVQLTPSLQGCKAIRVLDTCSWLTLFNKAWLNTVFRPGCWLGSIHFLCYIDERFWVVTLIFLLTQTASKIWSRASASKTLYFLFDGHIGLSYLDAFCILNLKHPKLLWWGFPHPSLKLSLFSNSYPALPLEHRSLLLLVVGHLSPLTFWAVMPTSSTVISFSGLLPYYWFLHFHFYHLFLALALVGWTYR